jgi:endonuclease-3 related protein
MQASPPDPLVREVGRRLDRAYRGQTWHWAPDHVQGPVDVVAGAVLVQHTTWEGASRALEALRAAGALDAKAMLAMPEATLASLIAVCGTPKVKARRLRALAATVEGCGGLAAFLALPAEELRERLLATHGVGPETADAVALYAAGARTFVIDAYTKRLFRRLRAGPTGDRYDAWRAHFEQALPTDDATAFQRYHAHIVLHGKARCRARPRCDGCPLRDLCSYGSAAVSAAG